MQGTTLSMDYTVRDIGDCHSRHDLTVWAGRFGQANITCEIDWDVDSYKRPGKRINVCTSLVVTTLSDQTSVDLIMAAIAYFHRTHRVRVKPGLLVIDSDRIGRSYMTKRIAKLDPQDGVAADQKIQQIMETWAQKAFGSLDAS